jgi:hypothetical protein
LKGFFYFFFEDFFLHWNIFLTLNVCLLNGFLNTFERKTLLKGLFGFQEKKKLFEAELISYVDIQVTCKIE